MPTAHDVANYFLTLLDVDSGDSITNLKMQKLVYYAQGFHLAMTGQPLFEEPIEAWKHGPVVPDLYHALKVHVDQPIVRPESFDADAVLSPEQRELLDEVYRVYGQFSAWKLRDLTHEETPWKAAYERAPSSVISHESLKAFFSTQLV